MNEEQAKFVIDKLHRLDGNALAACAAVRALILQQPDVDAATKAVAAEIEKLTAIGLGKAISESTLEGVREGWSQICPPKRSGTAAR